jgi:hypothetical protein
MENILAINYGLPFYGAVPFLHPECGGHDHHQSCQQRCGRYAHHAEADQHQHQRHGKERPRCLVGMRYLVRELRFIEENQVSL